MGASWQDLMTSLRSEALFLDGVQGRASEQDKSLNTRLSEGHRDCSADALGCASQDHDLPGKICIRIINGGIGIVPICGKELGACSLIVSACKGDS